LVEEVSGGWIVFANRDYGIEGTERGLAGDEDVAIRRNGQVQGAQFGIRDQATRLWGGED
jgi:hypothetical protein